MDGFKQRIIGALIIVSLAVIFLPMLFDEPHQERERQTLEIPPEPETRELSIDEPQEPEVTDTEQGSVPAPSENETPASEGEAGGGEDLPMADNGDAEEQAPEEPVETLDKPEPLPEEQPDTEVLEGAYLVQLGSFGSTENARRLRDKVRESDVEAYIESFDRDGETLTRVFAGPFVDRSAAEDAKTELDESLGLDTLVISAGE